MKILVTGASGFLGRRVVSHLSRKGHTPLCLDIVHPEVGGTSIIRCNLTDRQDLSDCLRDRSFDIVIHLAGIRKSGSEMNDVNVDGTSILLEVLHDRAGRVVILANPPPLTATSGKTTHFIQLPVTAARCLKERKRQRRSVPGTEYG